MKNLLENIAIFLVGLLSLSIVFFIVQYNLIEEDDSLEEIAFAVPTKKETSKAKTSSYLSSLEGYGDDVDVDVDVRKENKVNTVSVKSEVKKNTLGVVIDDKSKSAYMQNLKNYSEIAGNKKIIKEKKIIPKKVIQKEIKKPKKVKNLSDEPEKLEFDEVEDTLGMAIDALDL
jgi:hypothetical protein